MKNKSIKIIKKDEKFKDIKLHKSIHWDVYEVEQDKVNICVSGITIEEFYHILISDLPNDTNIDILGHEDFLSEIFGHSIIKRDGVAIISFMYLNLTDKDYFGKWSTNAFLSELQRQATINDKYTVEQELDYDGEEYALSIGVKKDFGNNTTVEQLFLECKNGHESLKKDAELSLNNLAIDDALRFKVKLPDSLKSSIKQYLHFFEDFVHQAKGYKIHLNVKKTAEGLEISIEHDEDIIENDISRWFNEYIGFIGQNIDNLFVSFETDIKNRKAELLMLDLKNQISHFKNRLEIEKVRSNLFLDENKFLRTLVIETHKPILLNSGYDSKVKDLKEKISKNQREAVIEELKLEFSSSKSVYNELITLGSKLNELNKSIRIGIVTFEEKNREYSKIDNSLISLIDEIDLKR